MNHLLTAELLIDRQKEWLAAADHARLASVLRRGRRGDETVRHPAAGAPGDRPEHPLAA